MEEKKKVIEVSKEIKEEIREKLGVTMRTVVEALQFNTNSPTAKIIRSYALNNGGRMYDLTINIKKKEVDNPYKEVTII
ncbi:MAG: hypothetical protein PHC95_07210 [Parabacteroides sp.]|nr:hypothetical protein [Parabacteroides sp.]